MRCVNLAELEEEAKALNFAGVFILLDQEQPSVRKQLEALSYKATNLNKRIFNVVEFFIEAKNTFFFNAPPSPFVVTSSRILEETYKLMCGAETCSLSLMENLTSARDRLPNYCSAVRCVASAAYNNANIQNFIVGAQALLKRFHVPTFSMN